jgi:hypothetical protein
MLAVQTTPATVESPLRRAMGGSAAARLESGMQTTFCARIFLAPELKRTVARASPEERRVAASVTLWLLLKIATLRASRPLWAPPGMSNDSTGGMTTLKLTRAAARKEACAAPSSESAAANNGSNIAAAHTSATRAVWRGC